MALDLGRRRGVVKDWVETFEPRGLSPDSDIVTHDGGARWIVVDLLY